MLKVLELTKSTYCSPFARLIREVGSACDEANDNTKYLATLKDDLQKLQDEALDGDVSAPPPAPPARTVGPSTPSTPHAPNRTSAPPRRAAVPPRPNAHPPIARCPPGPRGQRGRGSPRSSPRYLRGA